MDMVEKVDDLIYKGEYHLAITLLETNPTIAENQTLLQLLKSRCYFFIASATYDSDEEDRHLEAGKDIANTKQNVRFDKERYAGRWCPGRLGGTKR